MPPKQQADPTRYGSAWAAIMQLVREGYSWSGHERNRLLLNERGGKFTDASSLVGLDQPGDGRGLAVVDWDGDGDLDLWYRNRTAPRLQLMLNRHREQATTPDFVAVRLEGSTCNRDAIGAVVELRSTDGSCHSKSVRAGDLFLSQSSRWLHFGLGEKALKEVRVLWPGGSWESFSGITPGAFHLLREGSGVAAAVEMAARQVPVREVAAAAPAGSLSSEARVVLPARIPLPPLGFRNRAGQPGMVAGPGAPRLLVLWSAACPHCEEEIGDLAQTVSRLGEAGLEVVALSVDRDPTGREASGALVDRLGWPFAWGVIEDDALDRLQEFQRALFDRTLPLSVPLTLLCDREGNVAALYRGKIALETVLADQAALEGEDDLARHGSAPPLPGRWFTQPVDPSYAAEFMARQFEKRLPEDALYYLDVAVQRASGERAQALRSELAAKHHGFARTYRERREPEVAAAHFERALEVAPSAAAYHDYGTMLASYGQLAEAEELLSKALALDPRQEATRRALAMVRQLRAEGN